MYVQAHIGMGLLKGGLGGGSNIGQIFGWSRACVMSGRWTPSTGSWACVMAGQQVRQVVAPVQPRAWPWAMGSGISSPKNLGKQLAVVGVLNCVDTRSWPWA